MKWKCFIALVVALLVFASCAPLPTPAPTSAPTPTPTPTPLAPAPAPTPTPTPEAVTQVEFLGAMYGPQLNWIIMGPPGGPQAQVKEKIEEEGMAGLYGDSALLSQAKSAFEQKVSCDSELVIKANVKKLARNIPGLFSWGIIEPEQGSFYFDFPDIAVKEAQVNGIELVATFAPYSPWDLASAGRKVTHVLDFIYFGYLVGPPQNMERFRAYLSKTVERYDGDGVNDMPGLKEGIKYWEVNNEPEARDAAFVGNPERYFEVVKASYEGIKAACPDCQVVMGGALEIGFEEKSFWLEFFNLGGGAYIDVINFHYNSEKHEGAAPDPSEFIENLNFFKGLADKPMWITEFGTYSGSPGPPRLDEVPVQEQTLPTQSEEFQASWYVKYYTIGLAEGVTIFFPDLAGLSDSSIGGSAMFDEQTRQPRLYVQAQKVMWDKIGDFTQVSKLAEGQYKFTVNGKPVYVLWGSGSVPSEITGMVTVTDIYGDAQQMDASEITLSDSPIYVEM